MVVWGREFIHIPNEQRTKLDEKSCQCVFIGYGDEKFGYKIYDPFAKKASKNRDITFFEDHTRKDVTVDDRREAYVDDLVNIEDDK